MIQQLMLEVSQGVSLDGPANGAATKNIIRQTMAQWSFKFTALFWAEEIRVAIFQRS